MFSSTSKNRLDGLSKGRIYFNLYQRSSSRPWFCGLGLSRGVIVVVNRVRANHHNLAKSLHRKCIIDSPVCKGGYETEDLNHVLWNCDLYLENRYMMYEKLHKIKLYLPLNVKNIISLPNVPACKIICKFF